MTAASEVEEEPARQKTYEFMVSHITVLVEAASEEEATQAVSDLIDEHFWDFGAITNLGPKE